MGPLKKTDATKSNRGNDRKERNQACLADLQLILELVAVDKEAETIQTDGADRDDVLVRATVPR